MWPGMRPATGWMAKRTSTPLSRRVLGDFVDGVLGLRHGHAVAGDDDDALGFAQQVGGIGGADGHHLALRLGRLPRGGFLLVGAPQPKPPAITLMKLRFMALHMM